MNCKDDPEREFYIRVKRKFGWTKNVLLYQIENSAYEYAFFIRRSNAGPMSSRG
jgi:hypothetical protein